MNIDQTIKRIYSLYIDIKTNEFDELKKDIMMDDIKNLYVMVKNLGTQNESIINEKHREILNDIKIVPIETNEIQEESNEVIDSTLSIENEIATIEHNIDETSAFEFSFEEDIKVEESKEDDNINSKTEVESNITNENKEIKKSFFNSGAIQDYLNKDEAPKKEIYDYLDLNTRIGLVEKFFKGNSIELSECLMKMNNKTSKIECIEILKHYQSKYGIDNKDEIYQTFMELLDRKFS